MSEHLSQSTFYSKDGNRIAILLPVTNPSRRQAFQYFRAHGCTITPDPEAVPHWLREYDADIQKYIVDEHPEAIKAYSLNIHDTASIESSRLSLISEIKELKHLYIAFRKLAPKDMVLLDSLESLEVLTLIGPSFSDDHLSRFPVLPKVRMIDIQTTSATEKGISGLKDKYPTAEIYPPRL